MKHLTRPLEVKAVAEDGTFEGYGSVFGVEDSYKDVVMPGAFKGTIDAHQQKGTMPALLWQHDHREVIGVWRDMSEDEYGLKLKGQLALDTQKGRETYALLKMGAVKGLSIGYSVAEDGEEYDKGAGLYRLNNLNLWETSIVTFPANPDAQVTEVRSRLEEGIMPTEREFEKFLQSGNFTRAQAREIIKNGYKSLVKQDAGLDAVNDFLCKLTGGQNG